jgi:hypothetical protein
MTPRPRDLTDLFLSPVALELDRRLQRLSSLAPDRLDTEVAVATDQQPADERDRRALMLATLTNLAELHDWEVSWHPRGLQLRHERHSLVLGLPGSVREYVGL